MVGSNVNILYINSRKVLKEVAPVTVLQLCVKEGFSIPRFCYHHELSIAGNCRMCMVEIEKVLKPVIACATTVSNNMHIITNSELVRIARENVIEFLLINHPLDCPICDQAGECDLQDQTIIYGSDRGRFKELKRSVLDKEFGPIIKTVMTRCIHCTRCVRYAEEIIGLKTLGMMGRGKESEISTYTDVLLQHEMIGNIADICPVGALTIKPYAFKGRSWELREIDLVDIFDSLGSKVVVGYKGGEIVRVLPYRVDLVNKEWISDKIRFFYEGLMLNRLIFSLMNKNNVLVHVTNIAAWEKYVDNLFYSIENDGVLLSYIGGELDLIDSMRVRNFNANLGMYTFYADQYKKRIIPDFRINWLLNSDIKNFVKKDNILLINVNLKYESVILNSLIYKNIVENENQTISFIGSIFSNSYEVVHIGLSNSTLRDIQSGRHEYCLSLLNNKVTLVESGTQPLFKESVLSYIKSIGVSCSNAYLGMNSTELIILESCISGVSEIENVWDKKVDFLHIFGNIINFDLIRSFLNKGTYTVFSSHHMPDKYVNDFDLYLPIINFHEVKLRNQSNMSIWLSNQLIGSLLYDYLSMKIGDSLSHDILLKNIYLFFEMTLNEKSKKEIVNAINFEEEFNFFLSIVKVEYRYINAYKACSILSKHVDVNYNYGFINEIRPETYYKSNIYIKNSITLSVAYNNLIDRYSYL